MSVLTDNAAVFTGTPRGLGQVAFEKLLAGLHIDLRHSRAYPTPDLRQGRTTPGGDGSSGRRTPPGAPGPADDLPPGSRPAAAAAHAVASPAQPTTPTSELGMVQTMHRMDLAMPPRRPRLRQLGHGRLDRLDHRCGPRAPDRIAFKPPGPSAGVGTSGHADQFSEPRDGHARLDADHLEVFDGGDTQPNASTHEAPHELRRARPSPPPTPRSAAAPG